MIKKETCQYFEMMMSTLIELIIAKKNNIERKFMKRMKKNEINEKKDKKMNR